MRRSQSPNEFIEYLARPAESDRLPSLFELSKQLGVSIARLREQLEAAKILAGCPSTSCPP
jgi:hypothetical protein